VYSGAQWYLAEAPLSHKPVTKNIASATIGDDDDDDDVYFRPADRRLKADAL